eukprot:CAMPEP_0178732206 /NCGR_PEP_ID=MMETSP0744-20121128/136_1 /TAXON_ID=913974 /ORGANISM="Nitzschia punctata, Strain CCMP561" /LENGTH=281 /DNA_ID=CAMNT_0020384303 /DNA_START=212 /DNA_END=1054 /DNA_ORIENTATION=-
MTDIKLHELLLPQRRPLVVADQRGRRRQDIVFEIESYFGFSTWRATARECMILKTLLAALDSCLKGQSQRAFSKRFQHHAKEQQRWYYDELLKWRDSVHDESNQSLSSRCHESWYTLLVLLQKQEERDGWLIESPSDCATRPAFVSPPSFAVYCADLDRIRHVPEIMMQIYSFLPFRDRIYNLALVDKAFARDKVRSGLACGLYSNRNWVHSLSLSEALVRLENWAHYDDTDCDSGHEREERWEILAKMKQAVRFGQIQEIPEYSEQTLDGCDGCALPLQK